MTPLQLVLIGVLTVGPLALGLLAWQSPSPRLRRLLILLTAGICSAAAITLAASGSAEWSGTPALRYVGSALEAALIAAMFWIGLRRQIWIVVAMASLQAAIAAYEIASHHETHAGGMLVRVDPLSLTLVLIVSVIGSAIVLFAIGYMAEHEHHAPATAAPTNRFFFFLVGFLGLMNGLVLTDNLKFLSACWEGTTLCSFFLIGHDGTPEARRNARRALVINSFGGAALSVGVLLDHNHGGNGSLSGLIHSGALLPVALLLVATFTKSAQLPFQSWLLGAMVAPTPVSALLHSSTMVKAGSYLVLRLAPAYVNTPLADVVSLCGAFTFAVASALAISQSNAKKVLAYSTIANLGLIVACAGINNPLAHAAALMILVYHALSKALLFLCVGTIEQRIGSRDIEAMSGIFTKMPFTTLLAVTGMLSMMAPPFGMLLGKWMAIAATSRTPLVLLLVVAGSALTIFFWGKWLGRIVTTGYKEHYVVENLPASMKVMLATLVAAVLVASATCVPIYHHWIRPIAEHSLQGLALQADSGHLLKAVDDFLAWPTFSILGVLLVVGLASFSGVRKAHVKMPFMCGENTDAGTRTFVFLGPMDLPVEAKVTSWYFPHLFGEQVLTRWANLAAALLLLTLFARIASLWIPG